MAEIPCHAARSLCSSLAVGGTEGAGTAPRCNAQHRANGTRGGTAGLPPTHSISEGPRVEAAARPGWMGTGIKRKIKSHPNRLLWVR